MKTDTKPDKNLPRNVHAAKKLSSDSVSFPVVGIGASAGGLEALEKFLEMVPSGCGMAFVIVQHLDPTHKGMMTELLQRATSMKVVQVKDRTRVRPDCVYVIPPNKDMSILHGVLHLFNPSAPRGLRLPIDFFFRSLAQDQQERSIGVILSGMGSDGTLGLRAIKERAGLALVQEPSTAKYGGMPSSAIDAGVADIVAPCGSLPDKILSYLQRAPIIFQSEKPLEDKAQSALEKAVILLRARTGNDFSHYKRNNLYRRIERRMRIHQIDKIATYVRYLQENLQELDLLFKELLIGVTSFFRDPSAWEELRENIFPALCAAKPQGCTLRAWAPGCSTGEEAYSMAIVFQEALEKARLKGNYTMQIFATDLDRDAIDQARQGVYPENIAADVPPERLRRFFSKEEQGYRVRKEIREMVIFATQNLIMDPPFTKLDIVSCRNLMIYLTSEIQMKLVALFHYSLNPGGILFFGSAETIGNFTDLFKALNVKLRIYQRLQSAVRNHHIELPPPFGVSQRTQIELNHTIKPPPTLQSLADQLILQHFSPPAVLTNDKGDILYINGRTGKYLEPASGKANWNIFAMARNGLRYELTAGFQQALRQKSPVDVNNLKIGTNGVDQIVDIRIQPIEETDPLRGLILIVFNNRGTPTETLTPDRSHSAPKRNSRLQELEKELQQTRSALQAARAEMQTSQEELKSINEELQSTNEELQSTNEELTTSKEEMQSLNEELQTVNTELQAKIDDLSIANSDLKNLLNSTDIAILFLDNDLNVRRFTTQAAKIIKLIPADVGRPITDLASDLCYSALTEDAQEVLQTLAPTDKTLSARDGRWFHARIMPYRTLDNRIDGVVITFADVTATKKMELQLRDEHIILEQRFNDQTTVIEKAARTTEDSTERLSQTEGKQLSTKSKEKSNER